MRISNARYCLGWVILTIALIAWTASLQSCTITKINVYGNGNIVDAPCHIYGVNHCVNYEGVEIVVKGSTCDYVEFLNSNMNKNVLLNKGYTLSTDNNIVIFSK